MKRWAFAIDVGGTFTDCVAHGPDGAQRSCKLLSSGVWKGACAAGSGPDAIVDPLRAGDPDGFWVGFTVRLYDAAGRPGPARKVAGFEPAAARLHLERPLSAAPAPGTPYELASGEEAPIGAIRLLMGLPLDAPLPPVEVRLGTTRGTNALLERAGARTALAITRGFGDLLAIGTQARPKLFELFIRKPPPLAERVVEIDERVAADGTVLRAPDRDRVRSQLEELRGGGIASLAVCLLHACAQPAHEQLVAEVARQVGFAEVSISSERAPAEKLLARAQTTVMDAYLNPVLRAYVAGLRRALGPGSRLHIMTSAGGLTGADRFTGADSILSGPAGGVVGAARAAAAAGFARAIGFDMGGTSTDVSRWDGRFELEHETEKAGVHLYAPMLAIETVAAGGGSVCGFDGVKLSVGPQSAGADPGPACYGRGGPLTVTDCNLVLGRILPERFPFPLDAAAPLARLDALSGQIAAAWAGRRMSPLELAQGFVAVANAAMARAIRAISVAKGYDPADHVLVCFGGAGGQHACALARELRLGQVLIHPHAGVLSAWGIGLADLSRLREASVLRPFSPAELARLEPTFEVLTQAAAAEVAAEGIRPQPARRTLDLRYQGVDAAIAVAEPEDGDWRTAYERLHEQLYGYRHPGRPLEIVSARVEVVGRTGAPPTPLRPLHPRRPAATATASASFDGVARPTAVFERAQLAPGDEIDGPAIVCEATATTVIEPGWRAHVTERDELMLVERDAAPAAGPASTAVDPVQLEIFHHHFTAIAEQMGLVLARTAGSTNIKERLDFSCALFTAAGDLVVNAPHVPVHLGAMSETVRSIRADNPTLAPGDVFVSNDPYRGGSHLPDITVVTPVHDQAELLFFVASRAHHADVGGIVPGSMPPFSRSLAEEGVVVRNFKLAAGGRAREHELAALLAAGPYPARRVADNLADLAAQVAANQTGVQGLREMMARQGRAVVCAYMQHIQDAAARKMRRALARLAPGRHAFADHLDDGTPIAVAITVEPERAMVDFAGTGPVVPGNLNANRAIVTAAVLYCFRCLIDDEIPLNAGVLTPLEIRVPPGCLLDPPPAEDAMRAAAVVGGNVETSQRIVDVILGALGVAAASQGTMNNLSFGDDSFGYYETVCGGSGATSNADGADAVHTHMTNTRLTDPEVLERRYPVRVHRFAIRRGSGGAGRHRGGDGAVRELEFLRPLRVSILSERRGPYPPYGLGGGAPGALGRNLLWRAGAAAPELLPAKVALEVGPGDRIILETPGGGGFGPAAR